MAVLLRAKAEGLTVPAAVAVGAPIADLTGSGDTIRANQWVDNVTASYNGLIARAATLYAAGHDLKDPLLSPIYGDFHSLPPAILTSRTRDLFLSDAVRTHRRLREAGVEADLQVYEGLSSTQWAVHPAALVTGDGFGEITRFFDAHLAK